MMNSYDIDINEIKDYLKIVNKRIEENTTIVTPEDLKQDKLYHISFVKFKELVPNVSRRAGLAEDNTLPRIHVSTHLNGCIRGHAGISYAGVNEAPKTKAVSKKDFYSYSGGFYLFSIGFRVALKPNKKLCYDSNYTDEHWLVSYNALTRTYPCEYLGKVVLESVSFYPKVGKIPEEELNLCAEIIHPEGVKLDKQNTLSRGYWRLKVRDNQDLVQVEEITKQDFLKVRTRSAAMLNSDEDKPTWLF